MAEDIYIDLHYRGLKLGEALQIQEFGVAEAYLHCVAPMPVGSELGLRSNSGVEIGVRVTRVFEKVSGSDQIPGMMVAPKNLHGDALNWWDERVADAPEPESVAESAPEADAPADEIEAEEAKVSEEERPSSDTVVMDAVSPEEISDASSTTEEPEGEPANKSDTIVMDAMAPDEAPSDTETEPAGKKNKKKRRSRRKKR